MSAAQSLGLMHRAMQMGRTPPAHYTVVQRRFDEYNPQEWMRLISSVTREFGNSGRRWQWIMNNALSQGNSWVVDFYFENPHDATMFGLKY